MVPAVVAETTPDDEPMVAVDVELLVQVPPAIASLREIVEASQSCVLPEIGASEFTVSVFVIAQPVGNT